MSERKGPERVREVLESFLEGKGLRQPLLRAEAAWDWDERVGDAIAGVTRARGVRDATLIVEVRSSAWLMELNLMKGEILNQLNRGREEAPIERIIFVLAEKD
ncbi:DUF721 domain-containing protein [Gemmatimonadota bacterium]